MLWSQALEEIGCGQDLTAPLDFPSLMEEEVRKLTAQLCSNLAMVHVDAKRFAEGLRFADAAVKIEPSNVKALFRGACAHAGLGDPARLRGTSPRQSLAASTGTRPRSNRS